MTHHRLATPAVGPCLHPCSPTAYGLTAMGSRVTIIIPTCNRAGLVCPGIASALPQRHANLEVIVVDDGSNDDTLSCWAGTMPSPDFRKSGSVTTSASRPPRMPD